MSAAEIQYPASEGEVARIVSEANAAGLPIEIRGGGTKTGLGRPSQSAAVLSLAKLTGITNYDPSELVMAARAGTPLAEIEAALAANNQMLTFEPMDYRQILGADGEPTIGGVFAGNISGPRRILAGAARDNLLGVRFVNGSGEIVKSGGRVMKNVTGLDLVKVLAGSWGTLGVLCDVIFKVLPRPETAVTIAVSGLNDAEAAEAMAAAMAMSVEVSGAAHLPISVAYRFGDRFNGEATTVLRLEGLTPSVEVRSERLVAEMLFACRGRGLRAGMKKPTRDPCGRRHQGMFMPLCVGSAHSLSGGSSVAPSAGRTNWSRRLAAQDRGSTPSTIGRARLVWLADGSRAGSRTCPAGSISRPLGRRATSGEGWAGRGGGGAGWGLVACRARRSRHARGAVAGIRLPQADGLLRRFVAGASKDKFDPGGFSMPGRIDVLPCSRLHIVADSLSEFNRSMS